MYLHTYICIIQLNYSFIDVVVELATTLRLDFLTRFLLIHQALTNWIMQLKIYPSISSRVPNTFASSQIFLPSRSLSKASFGDLFRKLIGFFKQLLYFASGANSHAYNFLECDGKTQILFTCFPRFSFSKNLCYFFHLFENWYWKSKFLFGTFSNFSASEYETIKARNRVLVQSGVSELVAFGDCS